MLILLSLVLTPVLVHRLGASGYGIYALASAVGGFLGLLDLGLTPAVIVFLSRSWAEGDLAATRALIGTAFSVFLAIGAVGGLVLALAVPWIATSVLHVPPDLAQQARVALWISTAGFALAMWLSTFNAVPFALQRYDLVAARMVGLTIVTTVVTIVYVLRGGGLVGVMAINLAGTAAGFVLFYAAARALLPGVPFRPRLHAGTLTQLLRFGTFKSVGTLGGIVTLRLDQVVIGNLLGLAAVTVYAIPSSAAQRIHQLLTEVASPFFPRFGAIQRRPEELRSLYLRGTRLMMLISCAVIVPLFVWGDFILGAWIGGGEGRLVGFYGTGALRWLLAAFLIQSAAAMPALLCEASGRPEINNGFSVAGALMHVPLVLILVPRIGLTGAAVALFINSATQTVAFIVYASRRVAGTGWVELAARAILRPVAAALATAALAWLVRPVVHGPLTLAAALVVAPAAYLAIAGLFGAIGRDDLRQAARPVARLPTAFPGRSALMRILAGPPAR